jgi:hypothetical protein
VWSWSVSVGHWVRLRFKVSAHANRVTGRATRFALAVEKQDGTRNWRTTAACLIHAANTGAHLERHGSRRKAAS